MSSCTQQRALGPLLRAGMRFWHEQDMLLSELTGSKKQKAQAQQ
jgi:hypothetical protein